VAISSRWLVQARIRCTANTCSELYHEFFYVSSSRRILQKASFACSRCNRRYTGVETLLGYVTLAFLICIRAKNYQTNLVKTCWPTACAASGLLEYASTRRRGVKVGFGSISKPRVTFARSTYSLCDEPEWKGWA